MHGFIFSEIKRYAEEKLGTAQWLDILRQAEVGSGDFVNYREYPDELAVALVGAASQVTGLPVPAVLQDFGQYLGGHLMTIFLPLVDPSWRTLDFLEHTEQVIHHVVRSRNRQARPPALVFRRTARDEVVLEYSSRRGLCDLAKGIALGVAAHYGETVGIEEETCMARGDGQCRMRIRRG